MTTLLRRHDKETFPLSGKATLFYAVKADKAPVLVYEFCLQLGTFLQRLLHGSVYAPRTVDRVKVSVQTLQWRPGTATSAQ